MVGVWDWGFTAVVLKDNVYPPLAPFHRPYIMAGRISHTGQQSKPVPWAWSDQYVHMPLTWLQFFCTSPLSLFLSFSLICTKQTLHQLCWVGNGSTSHQSLSSIEQQQEAVGYADCNSAPMKDSVSKLCTNTVYCMTPVNLWPHNSI